MCMTSVKGTNYLGKNFPNYIFRKILFCFFISFYSRALAITRQPLSVASPSDCLPLSSMAMSIASLHGISASTHPSIQPKARKPSPPSHRVFCRQVKSLTSLLYTTKPSWTSVPSSVPLSRPAARRALWRRPAMPSIRVGWSCCLLSRGRSRSVSATFPIYI